MKFGRSIIRGIKPINKSVLPEKTISSNFSIVAGIRAAAVSALTEILTVRIIFGGAFRENFPADNISINIIKGKIRPGIPKYIAADQMGIQIQILNILFITADFEKFLFTVLIAINPPADPNSSEKIIPGSVLLFFIKKKAAVFDIRIKIRLNKK